MKDAKMDMIVSKKKKKKKKKKKENENKKETNKYTWEGIAKRRKLDSESRKEEW